MYHIQWQDRNRDGRPVIRTAFCNSKEDAEALVSALKDAPHKASHVQMEEGGEG